MQTSSRRDFMKATILTAMTLVLPVLCAAAAPGKRPNVLFIAVDDLRPELGCYGCSQIKSPNIDKLAAQGLVFTRAYCQQAICMASRASLMSGYRPDKGRIYNCGPLYDDVPGALSLNKHFFGQRLRDGDDWQGLSLRARRTGKAGAARLGIRREPGWDAVTSRPRPWRSL